MRTIIKYSAWKILRRILVIAKLYCETLFIFWLMLDVLPPMPLWLAVAVVCILALALERGSRYVSLKIKENYQVVEDQHYDERTIRVKGMAV